MLSVEEATRAVLDHATALPAGHRPLSEALGCLLAEEVTADRDLPPFDKALVDGFAVRASDLAELGPDAELAIGEEILAGRTPSRSLGSQEAALIMTGAPLPEGADAVIRVEDSDRRGERVAFRPRRPIELGLNRMTRGREMRAGEVLLRPGAKLNAGRLGLLASVGRADPLVIPRPILAIASTGDEIVAPDQAPGPGQIRNSNAPLLEGLAKSSGAEARCLPIAPDEPEALRAILKQGLQADVLLITGGVSAGKLDLVPGTLEALGVRAIFHKVRLKPGKPLLFGIGPEREGGRPGALVFGLPGNPVSGVVGFLLFVRPALDVLKGQPKRPAWLVEWPLARPFSHRGERPTYHPCRVVSPDGTMILEPLDWAGSPDLRTVAEADGFAAFPAGDRDYEAGDLVGFLQLI
ncbi:molybdopterin molybdotransferase MoeA [soil metagenome]